MEAATDRSIVDERIGLDCKGKSKWPLSHLRLLLWGEELKKDVREGSDQYTFFIAIHD